MKFLAPSTTDNTGLELVNTGEVPNIDTVLSQVPSLEELSKSVVVDPWPSELDIVNLVRNPNADHPTDTQTGSIEGWYAGTSTTLALYSTVSAAPPAQATTGWAFYANSNGTRNAFRVTVTAAATGPGQRNVTSEAFPANPRASYSLRVNMVRTAGTTTHTWRSFIQWYNPRGRLLTKVVGNTVTPPTETPTEPGSESNILNAIAPVGAGYGECGIENVSNSAINDAIAFDRMQVTETATIPTHIDGSRPTCVWDASVAGSSSRRQGTHTVALGVAPFPFRLASCDLVFRNASQPTTTSTANDSAYWLVDLVKITPAGAVTVIATRSTRLTGADANGAIVTNVPWSFDPAPFDPVAQNFAKGDVFGLRINPALGNSGVGLNKLWGSITVEYRYLPL